MPISTGPALIIDVDGTLTREYESRPPTLSSRAAMIVKLAEFARTNGIQPIIMTAGIWIKSGTRATHVLQKLFTNAGRADLWQSISQYPMYNRDDFNRLGFYGLDQIKAPLLDIIRKKITAGRQYTPHDYDAVILDDQDWQRMAATDAKKYAVDPELANFDLELFLALLLLYPEKNPHQYQTFLKKAEQFAAQKFDPRRSYFQCKLPTESLDYAAASRLRSALAAKGELPLSTLTKYFLEPLQNALSKQPVLQQYSAPKPPLMLFAPIKRTLPEPITTTPHHDTIVPAAPIAPGQQPPLPPQPLWQQQQTTRPNQELTPASLFKIAIAAGDNFLTLAKPNDTDHIEKLNFGNFTSGAQIGYPPPVYAYLASRIYHGTAKKIPYQNLEHLLNTNSIFWATKWLASCSYNQLVGLPGEAKYLPELVWFFVKKHQQYLEKSYGIFQNAGLKASGHIVWQTAHLNYHAACAEKIKALRCRFDPKALLFCWDTDRTNKEKVKAVMEPLAPSASLCGCRI